MTSLVAMTSSWDEGAESGRGVVGGFVGDVAGVNSNGVNDPILSMWSKLDSPDEGLVRTVDEYMSGSCSVSGLFFAKRPELSLLTV